MHVSANANIMLPSGDQVRLICYLRALYIIFMVFWTLKAIVWHRKRIPNGLHLTTTQRFSFVVNVTTQCKKIVSVVSYRINIAMPRVGALTKRTGYAFKKIRELSIAIQNLIKHSAHSSMRAFHITIVSKAKYYR